MSLLKKVFGDSPSTPKQKYHFIIVDDSLFDLLLTEKTIKNLNRHQSVHTFTTGGELIYHFNTHHYDDDSRIVLFIDIQMPNKTGIETIKALNTIINVDLKNKIAVFFLTASLNQEDFEQVKEISNQYEYVIKPISETVVKELVEAL